MRSISTRSLTNKFFLFFPLLIFSCRQLAAQEDISVSVVNLRNGKGHVLISLFRDCEGYPDHPEKAYRVARLAISGETASVIFSRLPAGDYSIAILHDENDDRKMNTNFMGVPKEGYGFSNNVMGAFGPPSCSRAGFSHQNGSVSRVLIYTRYGW